MFCKALEHIVVGKDSGNTVVGDDFEDGILEKDVRQYFA